MGFSPFLFLPYEGTVCNQVVIGLCVLVCVCVCVRVCVRACASPCFITVIKAQRDGRKGGFGETEMREDNRKTLEGCYAVTSDLGHSLPL